MTPHLAEELWQRLGHERLLAETPWPEADPALVDGDTVTVAVQVNGKRRAEIGCRAGCVDARTSRPALGRRRPCSARWTASRRGA